MAEAGGREKRLLEDAREHLLLVRLDKSRVAGPSSSGLKARSSVERECVFDGLFLSLRRRGSVLRFVLPWSTTRAQFDLAAEVLDRALRKAAARLALTAGLTTWR